MEGHGKLPEVPKDLIFCVQPELDSGFANPDHQFALVGRSGCIYYFGSDEARVEAEEQCFAVQGTLDEDIFIIDRPAAAL